MNVLHVLCVIRSGQAKAGQICAALIRALCLDAYSSNEGVYQSRMEGLDNVSPEVFAKSQAREERPEDYDDDVADPIDTREIFGELRSYSSLCSLESL